MRFVRKTVWAAFVWLTAAMTLVAGTPSSLCRCPSGRVKTFCLGLASETTGCCCDGTCCSAEPGERGCRCAQGTAPAGPTAQESCCPRQQDQHTSGPAGAGWQAGGACCTKALALPPVFAPATPKATPDDVMTPGSSVLFEAAPLPAAPRATVRGRSTWQTHLLPPPTDLVVALRRFLI